MDRENSVVRRVAISEVDFAMIADAIAGLVVRKLRTQLIQEEMPAIINNYMDLRQKYVRMANTLRTLKRQLQKIEDCQNALLKVARLQPPNRQD